MIFEATTGARVARVEVRVKDGQYTVLVDGTPHAVDVRDSSRHFLSLLLDGRSYDVGVLRREGTYTVSLPGALTEVALSEAARGSAAPHAKASSGPARVSAPMPGKVVRILCAAGDEIRAGQGLVVMEAMKMENEIRAPRHGRVKDVPVREGQAVETGALLVVVD